MPYAPGVANQSGQIIGQGIANFGSNLKGWLSERNNRKEMEAEAMEERTGLQKGLAAWSKKQGGTFDGLLGDGNGQGGVSEVLKHTGGGGGKMLKAMFGLGGDLKGAVGMMGNGKVGQVMDLMEGKKKDKDPVKTDASTFKALQTVAENQFGMPKDVTTTMSLGQLRGFMKGLTFAGEMEARNMELQKLAQSVKAGEALAGQNERWGQFTSGMTGKETPDELLRMGFSKGLSPEQLGTMSQSVATLRRVEEESKPWEPTAGMLNGIPYATTSPRSAQFFQDQMPDELVPGRREGGGRSETRLPQRQEIELRSLFNQMEGVNNSMLKAGELPDGERKLQTMLALKQERNRLQKRIDQLGGPGEEVVTPRPAAAAAAAPYDPKKDPRAMAIKDAYESGQISKPEALQQLKALGLQ